jgi:hypothetical protein
VHHPIPISEQDVIRCFGISSTFVVLRLVGESDLVKATRQGSKPSCWNFYMSRLSQSSGFPPAP